MPGKTTEDRPETGTTIQTPPLRALYPVEEAAVLISASRREVYYMIKTAELRSVKVGRNRRVPIEAINEWLAQHNVATRVQDILAAPQPAREPALHAA